VLLGLFAGAEDDLEARPSHHDADPDHDHDDFDSFVVKGGTVANVAPLLAAMSAVIAEHDVLRIKGMVAVDGRSARLVIQAVGPRIQHYYDRAWAPGEVQQSQLVVIGQQGLDCAAIESALGAVLG
ncbi:MAG TPA: GTP-binding protein, partial [Novosphingobium sp.]